MRIVGVQIRLWPCTPSPDARMLHYAVAVVPAARSQLWGGRGCGREEEGEEETRSTGRDSLESEMPVRAIFPLLPLCCPCESPPVRWPPACSRGSRERRTREVEDGAGAQTHQNTAPPKKLMKSMRRLMYRGIANVAWPEASDRFKRCCAGRARRCTAQRRRGMRASSPTGRLSGPDPPQTPS